MIKLEINKELVLNINHVSKETIDWLNDDANSIVDHNNTEYSYRLLVDSFLIMNSNQIDLRHLLYLAKSHGCKWLVLEEEGPTYRLDGLPYYEEGIRND